MSVRFLTFLFFLTGLTALCQTRHPYLFRQVNASSGLSDNLVLSIGSCPDGRISILTRSVFNLYNGATFDYHRQGNQHIYPWQYSGNERQYVDKENRIWIKQHNSLRLLNLNTNQFEPGLDNVIASMGIKQKIRNFFIDRSKNYWFLTVDNSLFYYDVRLKKLILADKGGDETSTGTPAEIEQMGDTIWIIYSKGLIKQWSLPLRRIVKEEKGLLNRINESSHALIARKSASGGIWLMHHTELFYSKSPFNEWKTISQIGGGADFFTAMDVDKDGDVWMGTAKGETRLIRGIDFTIHSFAGIPLTSGGTILNDISSIHVDEDNGVWIGTLFQGIGYYHPSMIKINLRHTVPNESHVTNENVRGFLEERNGNILIATGHGLFRYSAQTKKMQSVFPELKDKYCMTLYRDSKERIWIPTFYDGFYCIQDDRIVRHYTYNTSTSSDPNPNNGRNIFEDGNGQLWVSVNGGIGKFDPVDGKIEYLFESHPEIRHAKINMNFFPINKNTFAVAGEDLYVYNTKTKQLRFLTFNNKEDWKGREYNFIHVDKKGLYWLGIDGLKVWNPVEKKIYEVPLTETGANQIVSAILEDTNGQMWVSTMSGLSRVTPVTKSGYTEFSVINFDHRDGAGVQAGRFNTGASLKAGDGTFYFGGVHGVNIFHPDSVFYNRSKHKPIFTGIRLFNTLLKEKVPFRKHVILDKNINLTDKLVLKYNENFITIEFSGLNFADPSRTYFKYQLENYDQGWTQIRVDGVGKASYTGLPPGEYVFKVFTANHDKTWGSQPNTLTIVIHPPFWATVWAKILYSVMVLGLAAYLLRALNRRNRRRMEQEREDEKMRQKEKLEQMKLNFFTNISHEFRTPLSLIMTPLDQLKKEITDIDLRQKLSAIYKHSESLLTLVNQLLDFRKLEVTGEQLHLSYGDIVEYATSVCENFRPVAVNKAIVFTIQKPESPVYMYFDRDKVLKILNNLLSNAFKFTAEAGTISAKISALNLEDAIISISVTDTGIGIKPCDLSRIFERFHQSSIQHDNPSGSGIGLYLVKEYVELHHGKVFVESEYGAGSKFTFTLPVAFENENPELNGQTVNMPVTTGNGKKILIVEDNYELRQFLKTQLSPFFLVLEAANGQDAELMAVEQEPELILSDAMMPKVDGITLCKNLKSRIETSHIPFILLTANTSEDTRKQVYSAGADSYLTKPFVFDLLLTRIQGLMEQHEKRKALFHTTIEITPNSITINSLDEALVQKALQSVEDNIDNSEYNVEDLGRDIGLSRGNLYRKLQSITGKNPSDFIRSIRLKRAAQLLTDTQLNVGEIADMTGFNALKYFNKHFKDTFGLTPTQYRSSKK